MPGSHLAPTACRSRSEFKGQLSATCQHNPHHCLLRGDRTTGEKHPGGVRAEMSTLSLPALRRVAVCGGTHGNELSGVYLVRERLKKNREREGQGSFTVTMVMSNPRAVQQCRRYTETDLNRCFTQTSLKRNRATGREALGGDAQELFKNLERPGNSVTTAEDVNSAPISETTPYEIVRSQELNDQLGPKGSPEAMDLVCDLHNTTANMGLCFISFSDSDWICLHIYRHLQRELATIPVRYIHFDLPKNEAYSLETVGKHGFALEIGPQPHASIRSNIFVAMQEGVELMLEWIHLFNSGTQFDGGSVEVFTLVKNIDYPRDPETRAITAAIHPDLQDRDFCLLHPGDPLFLSFSGETLRYKGKEPLYPFFVNECAYYEKGIALSLAHRRRVVIPSIQCDRN